MKKLRRISTDINNLDSVLGGGLPVPAGIVVVGEQNSHISLFVRQVTWSLLNKGFSCLYYAVDESAAEIREFFKTIGMDIEPFEKKGMLQFADIFSQGVSLVGETLVNEPSKIIKNVFKLRDMIALGRNFAMESQKKGRNDLLVVLESFTPLFAMMERREVFLFSQAIKYSVRYFKALGIASIHSGVVDKQIEDTIRHLADGILEFTLTNAEKTQLEMRVQKIPGASTDQISITIDDHIMHFHVAPT
ncbi:MAG TPA: ATPase domain-containing protein [Candidatus Bathyarchaeia archaeon]|nr:ATPase domain-containing protein [Candidatus Bathyarchaeia archaeon]